VNGKEYQRYVGLNLHDLTLVFPSALEWFSALIRRAPMTDCSKSGRSLGYDSTQT
jgi:hypothetical protein